LCLLVSHLKFADGGFQGFQFRLERGVLCLHGLHLLLLCFDGFDENRNDVGVGDGLVAVRVCRDEFGQNLLHFLRDKPDLPPFGEIPVAPFRSIPMEGDTTQVQDGVEGIVEGSNIGFATGVGDEVISNGLELAVDVKRIACRIVGVDSDAACGANEDWWLLVEAKSALKLSAQTNAPSCSACALKPAAKEFRPLAVLLLPPATVENRPPARLVSPPQTVA
jgi:hypothetical protein